MSYDDFTLDLLRKSFGIAFREKLLWDNPPLIEPSDWLRNTLEIGESMALVSEKARSEFLVAPILIASRELLQRNFQIFSGVKLNVDPDKGLKGECDFILAKTPPTPVLQAPVMVILEAKKNDIDEGLGQCAAQVLAARIYNEQEGQVVPNHYGCVTTGEIWQFMRLQGNDLVIDSRRYFTNEINKILGILMTIMHPSAPDQQASDAA